MVAPGVECKVYSGKSALRRRLTECTDHQGLTEVEVGYLPVKEQSVIKQEVMQSEKSIRKLISRNLRKEIHPGTKPSIDFIKKILDDAYESGMPYDVSDIRQKVLTFAMRSTHQADYCIKLVQEMHFSSEHDHEEEFEESTDDDTPIIFDVEVFPNLFLVNWKVRGSDEIQRMINPTPNEISDLAEKRLVGFNNRRYDNHILYGRMLGYSNEQLYHLSRKIISNLIKEGFKEAYNLSYTDIYDFAAKKQSLKRWEIELGIHHKELGLPWDEPVPEDRWEEVGRVPSSDLHRVEGRLRAVEAAVREAEEREWQRTNPETRARAAGVLGQLEGQIADLEAELARAEASGDKKRAESVRDALTTKRAWLDQISSTIA